MADLTKSDVEILRSWEEGDRTGKLLFLTVVARIKSGTAGGATNKIVPSAFGMKEFVSMEMRTPGANVFNPAGLAADGSAIYLYDYLSSTAAALNPSDRFLDGDQQVLLIKGIKE